MDLSLGFEEYDTSETIEGLLTIGKRDWQRDAIAFLSHMCNINAILLIGCDYRAHDYESNIAFLQQFDSTSV